jgi:PAS domain S-box-containing protein
MDNLDETKQNEAILRFFYDLPFIGMAITSPQTKRWVKFNDRLCEILGYSREELSQITWTEITHPDDLELDVAELERVMRGETEGYVMDKRFISKDGSIIDAAIDVKCIRKEDCTIDFFVATVQDISDRKLAEAKQKQSELAIKKLNEELERQIEQRTADLHKSEARNLAIIHALPDLLLLLKPDGTCLDCIMPSSFDRSKYIPIKNHISEILSPETLDLQLQLYKKAIATGEVQIYEHQLSKFGKTVYEEVRITPYGKDEILVIVRDISDRKLAEAQILHTANQLVNTNRELESFSYSVSHDLRAPLRHMNGFVNALQQRLKNHDALSDPKVTHYLQVIEKSSQKMGKLIDGLLTLSRYGRRPLESKQISIRDLVDEAIEIIRADPHHNNLVKFAIGDLPTTVGDRTLLQQVFRNLIGNAVKFSRNQPQPYIEIDSLPDQTIRIRDNGVGFQMEYADKLFGAFQRLHNDKEFEGTGIGLAIVQRIVQRHGGSIWAEGYPDQGATFFIKL